MGGHGKPMLLLQDGRFSIPSRTRFSCLIHDSQQDDIIWAARVPVADRLVGILYFLESMESGLGYNIFCWNPWNPAWNTIFFLGIRGIRNFKE